MRPTAFEWDPAKNERNLAKHGVDFPFAVRVFAAPMLVDEDDRRDYGERRFVGLGIVEGRVLAIAYTLRGDGCRIISARRANGREQARYFRAIREEA